MVYDRLLITTFVGRSDLGFYSAALTIASIVTIFNLAVSNAYTTVILTNLKSSFSDTKMSYAKIRIQCWSVIVIGGIVFLPVSYLGFNLLIDDKLIIGVSLLPYLVIGKVFEGLYLINTKIYLMSDKARDLGRITISNMAGYCIVGFICSHYFGLVGVAAAFLISNVFLFMTTLRDGKNLEDLLTYR